MSTLHYSAPLENALPISHNVGGKRAMEKAMEKALGNEVQRRAAKRRVALFKANDFTLGLIR